MKMGQGMKALQAKVAESIMRSNERKRSKEPKRAQVLLKMRPDYKQALQREAAREGRSMTNYLLTAGAHRMKWEGEI